MITIEKLQNYLSKEKSDERDYVFKIPEQKMADGHIYGKYIMDGKFAFLKKDILPVPAWTELSQDYQILVDNSSKNSFTMSILNQIMPEFRYFDGKSRVNFVKDLFRQIAYDMEEKNLYKDSEYTRQRNHIRKEFMYFEDIDNDEILKKVIVDYFLLTVYILKRTEIEKFGKQREIQKIAFVPGIWKKTDRKVEYEIKNPTCILIENAGRYSGIIKKELSGLFSWQDEGMEDLFNELTRESEKKIPIKKSTVLKKIAVKDDSPEPTIEEVSVKIEEKAEIKEEKKKPIINAKITLIEIQKIAEEEGISITKKSEKTGKDLKKTIQELKDEILKKYE